MIVSHEWGFIFLRTQKTASTSIAIGLSEHCGADDVITPLRQDDEAIRRELGFRGPQHFTVPFRRYRAKDWGKLVLRGERLRFYHHMPAADVTRLVGHRTWDRSFTFAVERNPWDKMTSAYYWQNRDVPEPWPTFSDWVRTRRARIASFDTYAIDGRVVVDRVLRYEDLEAELAAVAEHLGLPGPIRLPRAKAGVHGARRPYRELIDDEDRQFIADTYAREIALMGYEF